MEQPRRKPCIARKLAWLALAMILVAQCLPWEKVVVEKDFTWEGTSNATSCFLPIHRWWNINFDRDTPSWPAGNHWFFILSDGPSVNTLTTFPGNLPERLPVNLAMELTHCAEGWAGQHEMGPASIIVPAVISAYLMTMLLMAATPFLTERRRAPKAILWLARIFVLLILSWAVRNMLIGDPSPYSHSRLENVGAGYWLTVAALGVEIVALFLISRPAEASQR
ncbi:MAG: hypothetical protein QM755_02180 [Luteolibacter sp.]